MSAKQSDSKKAQKTRTSMTEIHTFQKQTNTSALRAMRAKRILDAPQEPIRQTKIVLEMAFRHYSSYTKQ